MKRHESFSIREGWLTKGIHEFQKDNKIFSSSLATDLLGIGSNMVKSLKYWMHATTLIKRNSKQLELTELGKLISQYDLYFEDLFTLWFIHVNMILNQEDCFVFNLFFNHCLSKTFSKQEIYDQISNQLDQLDIEYSKKILQDEINMVIKIYVIDHTYDNPENNFICPLSDLGLLQKVGRDHYERCRPSYKKLDYLIVYYLLLQVIGQNDSISIDTFTKAENGPLKILNLDKNLVNEYLDSMKRNKLITINRTAGLNIIYIRRKLSVNEIFKEYFNRRQL